MKGRGTQNHPPAVTQLPLLPREAPNGFASGVAKHRHGVTNGTLRDPVSPKKLRGGYYTPPEIAALLAAWAVREERSRVLEPSAGDGELAAAALARLGPDGHVTAVEWDGQEAERIRARCDSRAEVVRDDFFKWFNEGQRRGAYDAVIGNPPFIRYQDFPEEHRGGAFRLMVKEGMYPSRLTNAWVPFVVGATRALRQGGRLALVVPAELLQVTYAAELREYLVRKYSRLTVVTFRRLLFDGIQQETLLLLGERKDDATAEVSFIELEDADDLRLPEILAAERVPVGLDHAREKWTQYYLSPAELGLVRAVEESTAFGRLGDYAEVDVGVVTGRNEFFVLTPSDARAYGLEQWCLPLVGRSAQIPGLVLREHEWRDLAQRDAKCLLLQLGRVPRDQLTPAAVRYVEQGEDLGYHERYKCAIRVPTWWDVPSVWVPDAFLLRQIHDGPRIVENRAGATCTDTIHRVRTAKPGAASWLATASVNSLTFAFAEIRGRSYGGGVLELEPTEAEGLPFPKPVPDPELLQADYLDGVARSQGLQAVLDEVDRRVLRAAGLTGSEMKDLRGVWHKLYSRRVRRKRRS